LLLANDSEFKMLLSFIWFKKNCGSLAESGRGPSKKSMSPLEYKQNKLDGTRRSKHLHTAELTQIQKKISNTQWWILQGSCSIQVNMFCKDAKELICLPRSLLKQQISELLVWFQLSWANIWLLILASPPKRFNHRPRCKMGVLPCDFHITFGYFLVWSIGSGCFCTIITTLRQVIWRKENIFKIQIGHNLKLHRCTS